VTDPNHGNLPSRSRFEKLVMTNQTINPENVQDQCDFVTDIELARRLGCKLDAIDQFPRHADEAGGLVDGLAGLQHPGDSSVSQGVRDNIGT
jgi:hypothetical protein